MGEQNLVKLRATQGDSSGVGRLQQTLLKLVDPFIMRAFIVFNTADSE